MIDIAELTILAAIAGAITGIAFLLGLFIGHYSATRAANRHLAEVAGILGLDDRIEDKLK